jgi:excisionase family DNA binding protein
MAQLRKRRSAEHQQVTQPRADQITYDCGFANGYIQGFDDSQAGRPSRYAYPSPETTVVKHKDDLPVQVYTVREVATILKVHPRTIERLVATNQLVAIHVGRSLSRREIQIGSLEFSRANESAPNAAGADRGNQQQSHLAAQSPRSLSLQLAPEIKGKAPFLFK